MAKVVGPLHSTEARGSVGSLTYNTWRGIRTVKTRSGPPGPATGKRLAMLELGRDASYAWASLSDDQRKLWDDYGNTHQEQQWTGQPKRLSGHSWWVRLWVRCSLYSITPPEHPPTQILRSHLVSVGCTRVASKIFVSWLVDCPLIPNPDYLELYVAGPKSRGRKLTLHDAVRLNQIIELSNTGSNFTHGGYGAYTIFWRAIDGYNGQAGPWGSTSLAF